MKKRILLLAVLLGAVQVHGAAHVPTGDEIRVSKNSAISILNEFRTKIYDNSNDPLVLEQLQEKLRLVRSSTPQELEVAGMSAEQILAQGRIQRVIAMEPKLNRWFEALNDDIRKKLNPNPRQLQNPRAVQRLFADDSDSSDEEDDRGLNY